MNNKLIKSTPKIIKIAELQRKIITKKRTEYTGFFDKIKKRLNNKIINIKKKCNSVIVVIFF
jgi:hypothetical protein